MLSRTLWWWAKIIIFCCVFPSSASASATSLLAKMEWLSSHSRKPLSLATPISWLPRYFADVTRGTQVFSTTSLSFSSSISSSQSHSPFSLNPHLQASPPIRVIFLWASIEAVKALASCMSTGASCKHITWRLLGGNCASTSSFNLLS